jgi:hypothetical protein
MTMHSEFDVETGVFTGRVLGGEPDVLAANTAPGCALREGRHDHTRVCIDIATGDLVPHQPPAPQADDWQTWSWDTEAWRWVSVPTVAALARDVRAERDRRLLVCDWTDTTSAPARMGSVVYAAWQQYRQDLRDISAQTGFPSEITWPSPPA